MKRLGIDVGGTFTDAVLIDDQTGAVWSCKVPTTPQNPTEGTLNGIRKVLRISGQAPDSVDSIGLGTTIATNTLIENKGAKTALIATEGFRDLLEIRRIARHDRADLYDIHYDNPDPIVPRRRRFGLPERITASGEVLKRPDAASLVALTDQIRAQGVQAVAICFLHAYRYREHEEQVAAFVKQHLPEVYVTVSHKVNPEAGEYERTATTCLNAYLGPRIQRYAETVRVALKENGLRVEPQLMQSNGGLSDLDEVALRPVSLVMSGPAGGTSASAYIAQSLGFPNIITIDMGGTSSDVAVIRNGKPELVGEAFVNQHLYRTPTVDITSIGAGGGSIAWVDSGGILRVGPRSAGAVPGPACYGRGGEYPTVTDANLVLGYLSGEDNLSGEVQLDYDAAWRAIETHVAKPLGMTVFDAATGIRRIVNALMAQALRLSTVEKGYDPREFVLLTFGGAGPLHATDLARELGIPTVLVPVLPGVLSAYGMIVSDYAHDYQRPVGLRTDNAACLSAIRSAMAEMEGDAEATLDRERVGRSVRRMHQSLDLRYLGQLNTITIGLAGNELDEAALTRARAAFDEAHFQLYHFHLPERPVQVQNVRLQALGLTPKVPLRMGRKEELVPRGRRAIYHDGRELLFPIFIREELPAGGRITGPAMIYEQSTTIVVGPEDEVRIDENGNMLIEVAVEGGR